MSRRRSNEPLVTVLMPVWNGETYIAQTIESVLRQTYDNWELVVVDDCSTDGTAGIVASYADPRIRVIRNAENLGIAGSLLAGLAASQGEYVARLDADDLCMASRLRRQVRYMRKHGAVDVLGGSAILIGSGPRRLKLVARRDQDIKSELLFRSSMIHPTVMFRKAAIPFWYDKGVRSAEDYDLWVRLAAAGVKFANLSAPVIYYRMHSLRTTVVRGTEQRSESQHVRAEAAVSILDQLNRHDLAALENLARPMPVRASELVEAARLGVKMQRANIVHRKYDTVSLHRRLVRELVALFAFNPKGLSALSELARADRELLGGMVAANPWSAGSGLWYACSRGALDALRRRTGRSG